MAKNAFTPAHLERRLVAFGIAVCRQFGRRSRDLAVSHIASQLIRSSTSPSANYGEARAAESRRDFAHKLKICVKELRETGIWLQYMRELVPKNTARTEVLERECNELISIFVASVKTLGDT